VRDGRGRRQGCLQQVPGLAIKAADARGGRKRERRRVDWDVGRDGNRHGREHQSTVAETMKVLVRIARASLVTNEVRAPQLGSEMDGMSPDPGTRVP
jgi:hypothetical protein